MFKPLIDPKLVPLSLDRPIELAKEFKLAVGEKLDGTEQATKYDAATLATIRAEEERIYRVLTDAKSASADRAHKSFILSAGAPGAGKTTLLGQLFQTDANFKNGVYVDPDESAMVNFKPYLADLEAMKDDPMALFKAYTQWRWASQYIAGSHLNRVCEDGHDVVYGTSATAPSMAAMYKDIRENGYDITTIIVAAPLDVRHESSRRRYEVERSRYTTQEDLVTKGRLFNERLKLYFEQSDRFSLYWRAAPDAAPVLAASGDDIVVNIRDVNAIRSFDNNLSAEGAQADWPELCRTFLGNRAQRVALQPK